MAVIELGDVTADPGPDVADRVTTGLDRRRLRTVALLAALGAVLACGAATRPEPPALRTLWTAPHRVETSDETSAVPAGDTIYLLRRGARPEVVAYALADGRQRWRWGIDAHLIDVFPAPDGGPVLIAVDPASAGGRLGPAAMASRRTVALRASSGAELWRRPGEPHDQALETDTAMLREFDPRGGVAALTRVRLEDGAPLWRSAGGPVQEVVVEAVAGRPARVVTKDADDDVTVLSYADGAHLLTRRLPTDGPTSVQGGYAELSVTAGRLLVTRYGTGAPVTDVYRLDTLDRVVSGPIGDCGAVLCSYDSAGFAALDPVTGRELWRGPEMLVSVTTGDRLLSDRNEGGEHVLFDSRTGRRLSGVVPGWLVRDTEWRDEVLLLRATTEPMGRTSVTRVDLRTGRTGVLGSLEPVPDQQSCRTTPGYLICTSWDRVVVAAVPR